MFKEFIANGKAFCVGFIIGAVLSALIFAVYKIFQQLPLI